MPPFLSMKRTVENGIIRYFDENGKPITRSDFFRANFLKYSNKEKQIFKDLTVNEKRSVNYQRKRRNKLVFQDEKGRFLTPEQRTLLIEIDNREFGGKLFKAPSYKEAFKMLEKKYPKRVLKDILKDYAKEERPQSAAVKTENIFSAETGQVFDIDKTISKTLQRGKKFRFVKSNGEVLENEDAIKALEDYRDKFRGGNLTGDRDIDEVDSLQFQIVERRNLLTGDLEIREDEMFVADVTLKDIKDSLKKAKDNRINGIL